MIKNIFDREIILEDERTLLRPLQENDFDNLLIFSLTEPEMCEYGLLTAAEEE